MVSARRGAVTPSRSTTRWPGRCSRYLCACAVTALCFSAGFTGSALGRLPEGRVYEQVSPEFKSGYPVLGLKELSAIAASGQRAVFTSIGAFNGAGGDVALNPYVAHRTAEGWKTEAIFPHRSGECVLNQGAFTPDLSRVQLVSSLGTDFVECERSSTNTLWVREADGSLAQASPTMTTVSGDGNGGRVVGAASDLSRLVLARTDTPADHVLPEEIDDETVLGDQLYEIDGLHAKLAAVNNNGIQLTTYCDVNFGSEDNKFGAVSQPAASEVFFSLPVGSRSSRDQCEEPSHPEQVFVRVAGSQTLEVSKPIGEACFEVPCPKAALRAPAVFQGASQDGSVAYFEMADTAAEPLVPGNKDHSNNLYVARIGCASGALGEACGSEPREVVSMELASPDAMAGQSAEVRPAVLAVSPDGSHAYFVAHGVLSETPNGQGETAADGAENLYVYDRSVTPARVSFVADLCSGPETSGSVRDAECPSALTETESVRPPHSDGVNDRELWSEVAGRGSREAQTTPDGRFVVFGTFARLIPSGPEADVDSSEDIYRYDAQTGALRRVSVAEAGQEGNGNGPFGANITPPGFELGRPQEQYELGDRTIADNGSQVLFVTREPLSARDATGQQDVYVWNEGRVGMISCGCSVENDEEPVITPSGNDIMFLTSAGLAPGDTDGLADLYDARVGGGFPAPEAPAEPCLGDSCYGPLSTPAPILVPGSVTQPADRNISLSAAAKSTTVKKARPKRHKRERNRRRAARRAHRSAHTKSSGRQRR